MFSVKEVIKQANSIGDERKLNILTFPTHERYETELCKTGHNFYAFNAEGQKRWVEKYSKMPDNYYVMPKNRILNYVDFDLILSQSRFGQFGMANQIKPLVKAPIVSLEHTIPTADVIKGGYFEKMRQQIGDINVFISEESRMSWGIAYNSIVINHAVDSNLFVNKEEERENKVLSVANDFINRDYCLNFSGWQRIIEGYNHTLVGDTEGLSEPAESTEDLVSIYNKHSVFLNTTTQSPIPTAMLEAMSCGCAVVSTATCSIPKIIENGVTGFISNDESELRKNIKYLLDNPDKARIIGQKAREKIVNDFNESSFTQSWNEVFEKARSLK
jgi:glycosyltransferase involved in cell wall biosynthesis